MRIAAVGRAFPQHYYDQETLVAAFEREWGEKLFNPERLSQLHRNVLVGGRYLTLSMERYAELDSFTAANDAFVEHAPGAEWQTCAWERFGNDWCQTDTDGHRTSQIRLGDQAADTAVYSQVQMYTDWLIKLKIPWELPPVRVQIPPPASSGGYFAC
jgi:hypothetical protein